ncbi:hypothetical protein AMATHDRAFT_68728 [Amanita thiersii Skay4041]|uniref:Major facilitator superfamily (MFS) profile domain-containing protein n=1 Tax=Amanita thiersii Skay4041 TaxID=703135 RepID=A0A2A9NFA7_9AGAR|nr:hypothetical protein AMATHDRAFT_68728 [Amanita thiersii Skay4041]
MEDGAERESTLATTPEPASTYTSMRESEHTTIDPAFGHDVSKDEPQQDVLFPNDGDMRGWMTVIGTWLVLFSSLGYVYSFGVYQDYYTRVFLKENSPSKIAWMGSLQLALPFAEGIIAGRLFDAGYIRSTMISGSVIFAFSLFMSSLVHEGQYYQAILSQGLGMGIGVGLLFTPSNAIVSLHFRKRRSLAYGIALSGSSLGAVAFPIILNHVIPRLGFASGVRVTGYVVLGCLAVGNMLIQVPAHHQALKSPPLNWKQFFRDPEYNFFLIGCLLALLGAYFPVIYLQLYSVQHNVDNTLAFYSLAILNGSGTIGRVVGNQMAEYLGIWNVQLACIFGTGGLIWAILGINNAASLVVVSVLYGMISGAWFSLTMAGLASLTKNPKEIGARVGVACAIASPGLLGSAPIQGALLTRNFYWLRPIAFSGTVTLLAGVMYCCMRVHISRRLGSQKV